MRIEQGEKFSCFLSSPHNLLHFTYSHILTQPKKKPLASQQANPGRNLISLVKFLQIIILEIFQLSSIQSLSEIRVNQSFSKPQNNQ